MKHIDPALALRAALDLASAGIRCFPCRADKRPTTPHGFLDATADPAGLRELWRLYPGVLVALPTGAANGIDVLDVDPRHDGDVFLAEVESKLPPTLTLQTLSGGRHLYFIHADGLRNSAGKIARGIDVRADGGYAIHWASAGLPVLANHPIAPWPDWLLAGLISPPNPERSAALRRVPSERTLAALVRFVASSAEGERNNRLFWAACRVGEMVGQAGLTFEFAVAILTDAAERAGLPREEAARTARSGLERAAHGR